MNTKLYDKADEMWGSLIAAVCEEFQDGALEFSDAIDDLLFLGFDMDEAYERLQIVAAANLTERTTLKLIGVQ